MMLTVAHLPRRACSASKVLKFYNESKRIRLLSVAACPVTLGYAHTPHAGVGRRIMKLSC